MFGSTILDVVVGLILVFLAVSLVASALTEALATMIDLRAKTLFTGIGMLLNDPGFTGLAGDLYNHALVNPLSDGQMSVGKMPAASPSYIDSTHFAAALVDVVQQAAGPTATFGDAIDKISDPQIKATLGVLYRQANGDAGIFHGHVAFWFNRAMDRLSGTYKRRTKPITFAVAFLAAASLNANPVRIADMLWQRPALTAQLTRLDLPHATAQPSAQDAVQMLEKTGLLLGWSSADIDHGIANWTMTVLGWMVTAGAALFGAAFWFDVLQRIVQLRGTGKPIGTIGA